MGEWTKAGEAGEGGGGLLALSRKPEARLDSTTLGSWPKKEGRSLTTEPPRLPETGHFKFTGWETEDRDIKYLCKVLGLKCAEITRIQVWFQGQTFPTSPLLLSTATLFSRVFLYCTQLTCNWLFKKPKRGRLASSVAERVTPDLGGCEFKPHVPCRDYFKKI